MRGILIGFVLLLVFLPVSAYAQNYYVDVDSIGGQCNDNNAGDDITAPWCTITRANSVLQAGDMVYVRAGIYTTNDGGAIINPDNNGTPGNPITYTNYGTDTVTLQSISDSGLIYGALIMKDYITIDGLVIDNLGVAQSYMRYFIFIQGGHDHNIITNCTMQYTDSSYTSQGIYLGDITTYTEITDNIIRYVGVNGVETSNGIKFQENTTPDPDTCDSQYCLVEGNTIEYCGHSGLLLQGKNHVVRNNTFNNPYEKCMDIVQRADVGDTRHLIEGNIFKNAGASRALAYKYTGIQNQDAYQIIRRNRLYGNYGNGLLCFGTTNFDANNNYIYHNVFYNNGLGGVADKNCGIRLHEYGGSSDTCIDNIIKNNINYLNDGTGIDYIFTTSGEQTISDNWWDSDGDPLFQDEYSYDFHPQSNSPCIDNGAFLTTTRSAGSGTSIPVQDAGYFMDGFNIVEGDLIQLEGQTTTAKITNVNYDTNTITVDTPLTWTSGQGVSLSYSGSAPDIGAYEFSSGVEPYCGDGNCDAGEDCSSCSQDCSCVSPEICCSGICSAPACSQNSDCGSDPCKTYTCNNPGTCSSACSSQDITSCINDDGCCPSGCDQTNDNDCTPLGGPVAWYHFDEGSGSTAADSSGNGNDGTINGAAWTTGISGGSLEFDGVNDYVSVSENDLLDPSEITMEAWVKIPSIPIKNSDIVAKGANNGYRFSITAAGKVWWSDRGGTNAISTARLVPINEWTHITVVGSSSGMRIYMDGDLEANNSVPYGGPNTANTLEIGAEPQFSEYFNGTIDEVRIYDRVLTPEEISEHYNELSEHIRADLNDDNVVDILDLGIVAGDFGKTSGFNDPDSDTNSNGLVDIFDIVFVASRIT